MFYLHIGYNIGHYINFYWNLTFIINVYNVYETIDFSIHSFIWPNHNTFLWLFVCKNISDIHVEYDFIIACLYCSRPIDIAIPSLMSVTIRHCIVEIILPQDHSIVQFSELFDIIKFARGHPPITEALYRRGIKYLHYRLRLGNRLYNHAFLCILQRPTMNKSCNVLSKSNYEYMVSNDKYRLSFKFKGLSSYCKPPRNNAKRQSNKTFSFISFKF